MEQHEARQRFVGTPVARFATVRANGRPHLVPVTFALMGDGDEAVVVFAVDQKPKRTTDLQRLRNIASAPRVSFLVDHYDDDWSALWWVRADAVAEILHPAVGDPRRAAALQALAARYPQYRDRPPHGPVVWCTVTRWAGWSAAAG